MKKKIALKVLFCLGILIGCSKDSGSNPNPPDDSIDRSGNLLATGASANDILDNTNFDRILFEIAFVEGFRPEATTIALFENFVRQTTFKTAIEFEFLSLPSPNEDALTIEEVDDLEQENRTAYNNGTTLAIYIYFADAPADGDDPDDGLVTLGAVYRNTSMIIYESTIRDLIEQSPSIPLSQLEGSTVHHEFGHLLGLVDLGTEEINPHEDPDAEHHCLVQGCLMRATLEFGAPAMRMLKRRAAKGVMAIPNLDRECIRDLQGNGGR